MFDFFKKLFGNDGRTLEERHRARLQEKFELSDKDVLDLLTAERQVRDR